MRHGCYGGVHLILTERLTDSQRAEPLAHKPVNAMSDSSGFLIRKRWDYSES